MEALIESIMNEANDKAGRSSNEPYYYQRPTQSNMFPGGKRKRDQVAVNFVAAYRFPGFMASARDAKNKKIVNDYKQNSEVL